MGWVKDQWDSGDDEAKNIAAFFATPRGLIVAGVAVVFLITAVIFTVVGSL